eukprot:1332732-Ditylum_brightwellii.AAC.1
MPGPIVCVDQCARLSSDPKEPHATAVKQIVYGAIPLLLSNFFISKLLKAYVSLEAFRALCALQVRYAMLSKEGWNACKRPGP